MVGICVKRRFRYRFDKCDCQFLIHCCYDLGHGEMQSGLKKDICDALSRPGDQSRRAARRGRIARAGVRPAPRDRQPGRPADLLFGEPGDAEANFRRCC